VPPTNHPAHPSASPNGAANGRRMSAYTTNAANYQGTPPGRVSRRGTGPPQTLIEQIPGRRNTTIPHQQQQSSDKDRDCTVM
jgi:hypothetical protein